MKLRTLLTLLAGLVGFATWVPVASAQSFSFGCITANDVTGADCDIAESQLNLTLSGDASSVTFLFSNTGSAASSITDIYFGAGLGLSPSGAFIRNGAGVEFAFGASPGTLPGGGAYQFSTTTDADSNAPVMPNGVNPGEWVSFHFLTSYSSVLSAMSTFASNTRVGVHVQGFADGRSESVVTTPVPEPSTYALMVVGLGMLGFMSRRRRSRA